MPGVDIAVSVSPKFKFSATTPDRAAAGVRPEIVRAFVVRIDRPIVYGIHLPSDRPIIVIVIQKRHRGSHATHLNRPRWARDWVQGRTNSRGLRSSFWDERYTAPLPSMRCFLLMHRLVGSRVACCPKFLEVRQISIGKLCAITTRPSGRQIPIICCAGVTSKLEYTSNDRAIARLTMIVIQTLFYP